MPLHLNLSLLARRAGQSLLWAALPTLALAEPATTPPGPEHSLAAPLKGEILGPKQFRWLDRNHDGYLSREEVSQHPRLAEAFDAADTDHNGLVSPEELRDLAHSVREQHQAGRPPAPTPTP